MHADDVPHQIPGIPDNIYGGFGLRLGSLLLDGLFCTPVALLAMYIQSFGGEAYLLSILPILAFNLWYAVYLPARNGATPGKLIAGLTILKTTGQPIGLKEAFLRNIVTFALSIFSVFVMTTALFAADMNTYTSLGFLERSRYLMSMAPLLFTINTWINNVWFYSELIVLLTNKQRRAIHDFIADTVIVKTKYLPQIQAYINPPAEDQADAVVTQG
jgi:uncharacterized RDD family membrane protein YckC